jgi:hypothetical protein
VAGDLGRLDRAAAIALGTGGPGRPLKVFSNFTASATYFPS